MGKSTISMAMFNSKLLVYQRVYPTIRHGPLKIEWATRESQLPGCSFLSWQKLWLQEAKFPKIPRTLRTEADEPVCAADWCHPRTKLEPRLFGETPKWRNTIGSSGVLVGCLLMKDIASYQTAMSLCVTANLCNKTYQLRLCGTQFYKCSRCSARNPTTPLKRKTWSERLPSGNLT